MSRGLILGCLLFCWQHFLLAQAIPGDQLSVYNTALASVKVLVNPDGILPLRRLDTVRLAFTNINVANDTVLWETINRYQTAARVQWLPNGSAVMTSVEETDGRMLDNKPYSPIIAIDAAEFDDRVPVPDNWLSGFPRPCVVIVLNGNSSILKAIPQDAEVAVIFSSQNDTWAQSLVVQTIFGGVAIDETADTALAGIFPEARGITTAPAIRLGYAPPAVVGMNAAHLRDSIEAIVNEGIQAGAFPGAQVLLAKNGKIIYHQTFGHHTYEVDARTTRTDDIYDLASITKISTGLPVLMRLYGEGRMDLDGNLGAYLPYMEGSNKANLRMRDLLAHQGRLRAWIPFWRGTLKGHAKYPWKKNWDDSIINDYRFRPRTLSQDSSANYSLKLSEGLWRHKNYADILFNTIRISPLNEQFGYVYSDLFFTLMPLIVQHTTGHDIVDYLRDSLYRPLGAYTMGFNPDSRFSLDRIVPTEVDTFFRMTLLHGKVHDESAALLGGISGHAGLFSSANDLAKLMQLYLNRGQYGGDTLIAAHAVDTFTRAHFAALGNHRGLGFDKLPLNYTESTLPSKVAGPASFGHSGYTGTFTWADPDTGLLLVFLSNRVHPTRNNSLISTLRIRTRIHDAAYLSIEDRAGGG